MTVGKEMSDADSEVNMGDIYDNVSIINVCETIGKTGDVKIEEVDDIGDGIMTEVNKIKVIVKTIEELSQGTHILMFFL